MTYQLDTANTPNYPYKRIISTIRTAQNGTIYPKFRQINDDVWFDAGLDYLINVSSTSQQEKALAPNTQTQINNWGSAYFIPIDLCIGWYGRLEVERTGGTGLAQGTIQQIPSTGNGRIINSCKGYAGNSGQHHCQSGMFFHHRLGRGTHTYFLASGSQMNVIVMGYKLWI